MIYSLHKVILEKLTEGYLLLTVGIMREANLKGRAIYYRNCRCAHPR